MGTLAADTPRIYELGEFNDFPVIATDIIYEGAAVGDNGSGYARPLVGGDPFRGFATQQADNSTGSAGDKYVHVRAKGKIQLSVSSLAITDVGRPVYATDDATFTLEGAGATLIGHVTRFVSTGVGIVEFDAHDSEAIVIVELPVALAGVTAADALTTYTPGFNGRIIDWDYVVTTAVTTGAKAATLNLEVGTTNVTGGAIALTSANCTPLGAVVAKADAFTAGTTFDANDTISVEASAVTAFAEGAGVLIIKLGK
jgi:hypothetical protein